MNRSVKRELMEIVDNAFAEDPMAARKTVAEVVLKELDFRPELLERAQEDSLPSYVEGIVGEYIRRSRARIRSEVLRGQASSDDLRSGLPAYEVVSKCLLTIPVGSNEYETKPALTCTLAELDAARMYYAEQKESAGVRERFCVSISAVMRSVNLGPEDTVSEVYRAA